MQSQFENMSKLKNELETEKKTVHKFVAQNVERQREIVRLKTELAKLIDLHSQEVSMRRRTLEEKIKRKHRVSLSEKKNGDPLINGSWYINVNFWGLVSEQCFLKLVPCARLATVRPI